MAADLPATEEQVIVFGNVTMFTFLVIVAFVVGTAIFLGIVFVSYNMRNSYNFRKWTL